LFADYQQEIKTTRGKGINVVAIYGGASITDQKQERN
jgi:hypothetical protein